MLMKSTIIDMPAEMLLRIDTQAALSVIAGKAVHDNQCRQDYHLRDLLDDADFLADISDAERAELYRAIAANDDNVMPNLHRRMASVLEDVL